VSAEVHFGSIWVILTQLELPEGMEKNLPKIYAILCSLRDGKHRKLVDNPAYVAPAPGETLAPGAPRSKVVEYINVTEELRRGFVYDLRDLCMPMSKKLNE
jgi:hypothetical protein